MNRKIKKILKENSIDDLSTFNESQSIRIKNKIEKNINNFNTLTHFTFIKNLNNVIEFSYNNENYFYYPKHNDYRKKKDSEHITYEQIMNLPPLEELIPFGKYKDMKISEIIKTDMNYINWLLSLKDLNYVLRFNIKKYLEKQNNL